MNNLFVIPSDRVFVDELAAYLWKLAENDPASLAEYGIVLPTNRSIRSLKEAFVACSDGKAALLPRMMTINSFADDLYPYALIDDELRVIPDFSRQFLLAELIRKTDGEMSMPKALGLSASLLNVLDDFIDYDIDYDDLIDMVPENFAAHWQNVLAFLEIITKEWKDILSEKGYMDKKDAYNRKIDAVIAKWKVSPYEKPLILAGLSYVSPAVKKLLPAVLGLPKGMVVFHGLDRNIADDVFQTMEETHPQYSFKKLLDGISSFADVDDFVFSSGDTDAAKERVSFLNDVMRPASIVHKWPTSYSKDALQGMCRFDCADLDSEADTISLILRAVLERKGKTAIVVTKNRDLARMIKGKMQRWRVDLDDSSGHPLSKSKTGTFLKLIINYALRQDNHAVLMELLKHPFSLLGRDFTTASRINRKLEQKLRGRDHNYSLAEIKSLCEKDAELSDWIADVEDALRPLLIMFADSDARCDFGEVLREHVKVAEKMAASSSDSRNLWSGTGSFREGTVFQSLIPDILDSSSFMGKISLSEYEGCLDTLLDMVTIRPVFGMNARLDVLSPIESRLQRADVVIIAGLNEKTWTASDDNPWLSREMKKKLGLLSDDFNIGLTAMDFINMAAGKEVYLTRSLKEDGIPVNPSRWLLRMEALLEKQSDDVKTFAKMRGLLRPKENDAVLYTLENAVASYVKSFYRPQADYAEAVAGEPRVGIKDDAFRFKDLSVTDLERLWHDPYAVYVKKVLRLMPLKEIEVKNDSLEFGTLVHALLNDFIVKGLSYDDLKKAAGEELKKKGFNDVIWERRLKRFIEWFAELDVKEKKRIIKSYTEIKGVMPMGAFSVNAKADRVDFLSDRSIRIIDYKTSSSSKYVKNVRTGYSPQLPIEAMMAESGAFAADGAKIDIRAVSSLEYWQFDDKDGGKKKTVQSEENDKSREKVSLADLISSYRERTLSMLDHYAGPDAVYLARRVDDGDDHEKHEKDYDHLSRLKEWFDDVDNDE